MPRSVSVPRRTRGWLWAGRGVAALTIAGLALYLHSVGLERADKLGSAISTVIALAALLSTQLLPAPPQGDSVTDLHQVEDSSAATATAGGLALSGLQTTSDDRPAQVSRSGEARAEGPGSVAITGIQQHPKTQP